MALPVAAIAFQGFLHALFIGFFVFLKRVTPRVVKWVLLALGMGFVTFTGTDWLVSYAQGLLNTNLAGLPVYLVNTVEYIGVFDALQIIFGGYIAGLTFRYGTAASVKKFRFLA